MNPEFDLVTIRLRSGDRDVLRNCFHPVKYNLVIRGLVSAVVDKIQAAGSASTSVDEAAAELQLEEIESSIGELNE